MEYICLQAHCGLCNHICVKSPLFKKQLESGKLKRSELALDVLVHRFEKKNEFFFPSFGGVSYPSRKEIEGFIRLGASSF